MCNEETLMLIFSTKNIGYTSEIPAIDLTYTEIRYFKCQKAHFFNGNIVSTVLNF